MVSPMVVLVDTTPDPRNTRVLLVALTFCESVTGLDLADLSLTRGGANVSLTGLTLHGSAAIYTLHLTSVTTTVGAYELKLTAVGSGIVDSAGDALTADAADTWTIDLVAAT